MRRSWSRAAGTAPASTVQPLRHLAPAWMPPETLPLVPPPASRLATTASSRNDRTPPPGYVLEWDLGSIRKLLAPGHDAAASHDSSTARGGADCAGTLLGHLETAPLPLLRARARSRAHPDTGQECSWPGDQDPLRGGRRARCASSASSSSIPIPPRRPPHAELPHGLAGLLRAADYGATRHVARGRELARRRASQRARRRCSTGRSRHEARSGSTARTVVTHRRSTARTGAQPKHARRRAAGRSRRRPGRPRVRSSRARARGCCAPLAVARGSLRNGRRRRRRPTASPPAGSLAEEGWPPAAVLGAAPGDRRPVPHALPDGGRRHGLRAVRLLGWILDSAAPVTGTLELVPTVGSRGRRGSDRKCGSHMTIRTDQSRAGSRARGAACAGGALARRASAARRPTSIPPRSPASPST